MKGKSLVAWPGSCESAGVFISEQGLSVCVFCGRFNVSFTRQTMSRQT